MKTLRVIRRLNLQVYVISITRQMKNSAHLLYPGKKQSQLTQFYIASTGIEQQMRVCDHHALFRISTIQWRQTDNQSDIIAIHERIRNLVFDRIYFIDGKF
uniref:Uncharacterized protein n=1 Tax=Romanomermis culicivorax TaxID=13658 RepID=A0A915I248_ROMCU